MKKHDLTIVAVVLIAAFTINCGGKVKEARDTISNLKHLSEAAEDMAEEMESANEAMEERRKRGDTLAMHYEELAKFLPESIDDYEKSGDLDGGTTNMPGGSFSTVSQRYQNGDGYRMKVTLLDYNAAQMMFMTAMATYASGFSIDTPESSIKGLKVSDEVKGWQELQKKQKKAKSVVGIANRFYLEVEADNQQNTDFTNAVITDKMEIDELASM